MSKRLYPPNIGGTIPAFCGTVLTVPFSMNKAVGKGEVGGFALKIKTVNGEFKGFVKVLSSNAGLSKMTSGYDMENNFEVKFDVSDINFTVGQYYKVQLAYIYNDKETVGYYSTVGVAKYTTQPVIGIEGLRFGHINTHNYFYTGVYSQLGGDTTEKMYSSRFQVFDHNGKTVEDTGYVLHNTMEDDLIYEQHESFQLAQDLPIDESYYIQFSVITTNNLEIKTSKYRIMQRRSISPEIEADLKASCDFNNGFVNLSIMDEKDDVISGKFLISRASSQKDWAWEEFRRFDLHSMVPEEWALLDCTVEQGVTYRYSLQQYNDYDIYSDRIISNDVYVDFEDAFLYDGEKQLKIKFNPQVSSFGKTILESKVETIGGKYPFISRNGNISYKEMPISGLISYQMDDINLFMPKEDLGIQVASTNLTSENITAERVFKMAVLDWLTNGKPKIFRSPTEGNFIVYLMNVSLSPENGLGRMLHSFNCSAVEVGDFSIPALEHYGLMDLTEDLKTQTRWVTVSMNEVDTTDLTNIEFVQINTSDIYSVSFMDMIPGSRVMVGEEILEIGATGAYFFNSTTPITYVGVQAGSAAQGICTMSYKTKAVNIFNNIRHVEIIDTPIKQIIGNYYKQQEFPYNNPNESAMFSSNNILDIIQDSKHELLKVNFARFMKRPSHDIYVNIQNTIFNPTNTRYRYYEDMDCAGKQITQFDDLLLYPIRYRRGDYRELLQSGQIKPYMNEGHFVDAMAAEYFAPYTGYAIDGLTKKIIELTPEIYDVILNDESLNIADTEKYMLKDTSGVTYIEGNAGVISEVSHCVQLKTYAFEYDNPTVKANREVYEAKLEVYMRERRDGVEPMTYSLDEVIASYNAFLIELNRAIIKYKEDNGLEI